MPRSQTKLPPSPDPLDLINHIRQCSLEEFHNKLEDLRRFYPDSYQVVVDLILSCKPKPKT